MPDLSTEVLQPAALGCVSRRSASSPVDRSGALIPGNELEVARVIAQDAMHGPNEDPLEHAMLRVDQG
jgi:hypothetical protein